MEGDDYSLAVEWEIFYVNSMEHYGRQVIIQIMFHGYAKFNLLIQSHSLTNSSSQHLNQAKTTIFSVYHVPGRIQISPVPMTGALLLTKPVKSLAACHL